MDCILSEDSIEFNKAKEINSSIESKAYEDVLFNKKIIWIEFKEIWIKLVLAISGKYPRHVLMIKKYILDDGIITLAYFHEDLKDPNCF